MCCKAVHAGVCRAAHAGAKVVHVSASQECMQIFVSWVYVSDGRRRLHEFEVAHVGGWERL